jgi:hypothetical protein
MFLLALAAVRNVYVHTCMRREHEHGKRQATTRRRRRLATRALNRPPR